MVKKKTKIPMAIAIPVAVVAIDTGKKIMAGQTDELMANVTMMENGKFNSGRFFNMWGPILAGAVVHKGASYLGVNRAMAKIPLINI